MKHLLGQLIRTAWTALTFTIICLQTLTPFLVIAYRLAMLRAGQRMNTLGFNLGALKRLEQRITERHLMGAL